MRRERGVAERGDTGKNSRTRDTRASRETDAITTTFLTRRSAIAAVFGITGFAAVVRLLDYQLMNAEKYRQQADIRRLSNITLYAKRGTIYDRNGNVLAASEECRNVYVNPKLIKNKDKAVAALVEILGEDEARVREICNKETTFAYIRRQVDMDDAQKLEDKGIAGIEFEQAMKRVYPYGKLASQVLGVVNLDNEGISGLEHYYDDILKGTNGSIVRERARDGSFIAGGAYKKEPAVDGTNLILSIDTTIQASAEEAMELGVAEAQAKYGSAVVCDPTTGEILAACSYPTYDQQDLANARYEDMNLRIVTDAYEPGSVFKTLVAGMGCDMEVINPDTNFYVPAVVKAGDDDVHDVDNRDFGMDMTLREILRRSSNTGMILVGQTIGADHFAEYLKAYGIGEPTGIDFSGESTGIVRARENYDGASVAAMSFGQALAVSPVQMLRAETGIANKGIMSVPHFLKAQAGEEIDWSKYQKRAISEAAAEQISSMMQTVVAEGTGAAAQIEGYTIAGKTGTAQRAGVGGGYEKGNNMASFLGFVSPEDSRAMVYITLDGTANMSAFAIKPFRTIMQSAIDVLGIERDA
ncbi:penicillin-binding protein 2 [Collinsella sp. zg1085]|nr:penicillin-binding protein 2 [Collinsella sp. zg1085]